MAKMMMGQIDHARARVRAIKSGLLGDKPESEKTYSTRDLVNGLKDGSVKFSGVQLQKFAQEWASSYLREASRYNQPSFESIVLDYAFSKERTAEEARWTKENAIYQDRLHRVNVEATQVEDAIVLGDQHAALIALQAFAAFKL